MSPFFTFHKTLPLVLTGLLFIGSSPGFVKADPPAPQAGLPETTAIAPATPGSVADDLTPKAELFYKNYAPALYQIETISLQSNKKFAIGSGFQISADGYIATNYHVISSAVMTPELFRVLAKQNGKTEFSAEIAAVDVIHDLAILKITPSQDNYLPLGNSNIREGRTIFSLGNPRDLGMSIKSGLANGYVDKAIYKKILTSLSLNPGMSGGPTINEEGQVIGINVAVADTALSFLVPVEFLKDLLIQATHDITASSPLLPQPLRQKASALKSNRLLALIEEQLLKQEQSYLLPLLKAPWEKQRFGHYLLPAQIAREYNCWGTPNENPEIWVQEPALSCASQDDIFLSENQNAHATFFNYSLMTSRSLDPMRLYTLANESFTRYSLDLARAVPQEVQKFECRSDRTLIGGQPFWVSSCARNYLKLPKLYDINVLMSSLGDPREVMEIELTLGAVSRETATQFIARFMREIEWTK